MSIESMQLARVKNHLAKPIRLKDNRVLTRAEWLTELIDGGAKPFFTMVNKIKPMSRAASNRAYQGEQDRHEERMKKAGLVPEYCIGSPKSHYVIGKIEYDFAIGVSK
jgi:hypothetical protein